ncbi:hypothetical protein JW968_07260 [Candidatus Woesearchaeota archaeon]|nr:hypothetical protein [Candidatus Woesearchaeota archaeon]
MKISNNVIAVLVIMYIITIGYSNYSLHNQISGQVTAAGKVRICIGGVPTLTNLHPQAGVYSGVITVSVYANYTDYNLNVSEVSFDYRGASIGSLGTDYFDGDDYFNVTWDTTTVPDSMCGYFVRAAAKGECADSGVFGGLFSINNVDIEPIWENYKNNYTTNLSNFTAWIQLSDITIGNEHGDINYSGPSKVDLDEMNIDANLIIEKNFIRAYGFNTMCILSYPQITLHNISAILPIILKNGEFCSDCLITDFTNGSILFEDTAGFEGNYTTIENASLKVNISIEDPTQDNSPYFNVTTYATGYGDISFPIIANCSYRTDYNPTSFTLMAVTGGFLHWDWMPKQSLIHLYIPQISLYKYIQHWRYIEGNHTLDAYCTHANLTGYANTTFRVKPPNRDKVFYKENSEAIISVKLEESTLNVTSGFSDIDPSFNPADVTTYSNGRYYNVTYGLSLPNTVQNGQYNVTTTAYNNSQLTMDNTMFFHIHRSNTWLWDDVDHAVSCYTNNPGWYFDELNCSWVSDVNFAIKQQASALVEDECDDGVDNDGDLRIDCDDPDCAGVRYECRNSRSIDSAIWLDDPCMNNVCWFDMGATTVYYIKAVKPGSDYTAKFKQCDVDSKLVQVALNDLPPDFGISDSTTETRQLPTKLYTTMSLTSKSYTPDGNPDNDRFTGHLWEMLRFGMPAEAPGGGYDIEFVRSMDDGYGTVRLYQTINVTDSAPANESDYINSSGYAEYCNDGIDNDLNSLLSTTGECAEIPVLDCLDIGCDGALILEGIRCEYGTELTCDDGFDNDGDGYIDCFDNDCFMDNESCPLIDEICYDLLNNDYDYGYFGVWDSSTSYQDSTPSMIAWTDCLDDDCHTLVGNLTLDAICEFGTELTCDDRFDNDADGPYDCYVSGSYYERDCDRWHRTSDYLCALYEVICYDNNDNDLDYDHPASPQFGGIDCGDIDCDTRVGDLSSGALCEYGTELTCDDDFDNDRDGDTDCYDLTCYGTGGVCYPCPYQENISIDSCADSSDNDADGAADCDDADCYGQVGPDGRLCGVTETDCSDGLDNDHDGFTDCDDMDCAECYYGPAEFCNDGLDNDGDGLSDCGDTECNMALVCLGITPTNVTDTIVGVNVTHDQVVTLGNNLTAEFMDIEFNGTVLILIGHVHYPISQINSEPNENNTYMYGTTTGFIKLVNNNTIQLENPSGFEGDLDLSAAVNATEIGLHELRITVSVEGNVAYWDSTIYVTENEPPLVTSVEPPPGTVLYGASQEIVINVTDNRTYNTGIDYCEINISGEVYIVDDCSMEYPFPDGTWNISYVVYDGVGNSASGSYNITVVRGPYQSSPYYAYTNYPDRMHFSSEQLLGIGVNFNSSNGFTTSTGCLVKFYHLNETYIKSETVPMNNLTGDNKMVSCTGEVPIGDILNTNITSEVIRFDVTVTDDADMDSTSARQSIFMCSNLNDSGVYRCLDSCELGSIFNNPPYLIQPIPDQIWKEDTSLTGLDLDDYFADPDGDPLVYTWSYIDKITISMNQYHVLTFTPEPNWFGIRLVTFRAEDPYGEFVYSNQVMLKVMDMPDPRPSPGGGGGGGGGGSPDRPSKWCTVNWTCNAWSECLPSGIQIRVCTDINNCESPILQPNLTRECIYEPTCHDGIQNHGETGIDCGGPCSPCPTCNDGIHNGAEQGIDCGGPCPPCPLCRDGIKNQGEERTDCGGPCPPCPTCHDGIQNQGETGIDVGGPCPPKRLYEQPMMIMWVILWWLLIILALCLLAGYLFYKYYGKYLPDLLYNILRWFPAAAKRKDDFGFIILQAVRVTELEEKSAVDKLETLAYILRVFMKEVFDTKYSSTLEEMIDDARRNIDNILLKDLITHYILKLNDKVYGKKQTDGGELKEFFENIRKIVTSSVDVPAKEQNEAYETPLKDKEEIFKKLREIERRRKVSKGIQAFNIRIRKINTAIKTKKIGVSELENLRRSYEAANDIYKKMNKDERTASYESLKSAHEKITRLEEGQPE